MNRRKLLFVCTIIMLGIGIGIAFVYDKHGINNLNKQSITRALLDMPQNMPNLSTNREDIKPLEKPKGEEKEENAEKENPWVLSKKEDKKIDLSSGEDLTVAIMNLVGIEEHLFFTGAKTQKTEYYDLINEVREIRKSLLKKLIPKYEGEIWCISKHLLAASYRLMEVGTKQLNSGSKQEAYESFDQAYRLYLMFWQLNIKSHDVPNSSFLSFSSPLPTFPASASSLDTNRLTKQLPDNLNENKLAELNSTYQVIENDPNHALSASENKSGKTCLLNGSGINCCAE